MSYATNPRIKKLLTHSYGQGGSVALPRSNEKPDHLGKFPAGVQDVLYRVVNQCLLWPLSEGSDAEWCFLVGGPGNGKSEALSALAGTLGIELPTRVMGEPAPRVLPTDWPNSAISITPGLDLEIAFINDASIPRLGISDKNQPDSLFLDIADGFNRFLHRSTPVILFANINRGILVEEQAAAKRFVNDQSSTVDKFVLTLINWLAEPTLFASSSVESNANVKGIQILVTPEPTKPYYGQIRIPLIEANAAYNVVIHVVFLDVLSLLEPSPGAPGPAIDFAHIPPEVMPYQPFGSLSDGGASRDSTAGGELLELFAAAKEWEEGGCINTQDGTLCEAFASCPFAQNSLWLRNRTLRQRFLDLLRATEIASARRLTYRDMLGYFSHAILGQPEREWVTSTHPCQWVEGKIQTLASSRIGKKKATADLITHRIYANMFTISGLRTFAVARSLTRRETLYEAIINRMALTGEAPPSRAFEKAFANVDPARDIETWNGVRLKVLDTVEALEIVYPSDQIAQWHDLPSEIHSQIERALDQVLRDEIVGELGGTEKLSREASIRVQLLRKWRSLLLLRQVGLALGQMAFRSVFAAWLAEQDSALQNQELLDLGKGIQALLLPPAGRNEFLLAPLRPRTYDLNADVPKNTLLVTIATADLRVEIVPQGDMLTAEIQLTRARDRRPPETIASLVIDLPIAREALLHSQGRTTSFTEIGDSSFARIERVIASLIGRENVKNVTPYFTDKTGKRYRINKNPAGAIPLRVLPSGR